MWNSLKCFHFFQWPAGSDFAGCKKNFSRVDVYTKKPSQITAGVLLPLKIRALVIEQTCLTKVCVCVCVRVDN